MRRAWHHPLLLRGMAAILLLMAGAPAMPAQAQWFDWLFRPAPPPAPAPEVAPRPARPRPANPAQPRGTAPAPKPVQTLTPAQERPLLQFSETIGALAFLTELCPPKPDVNPWLQRMEALLVSDGDNFGLRERMIGAYNQGFSTFATPYRECTGMAEAARRVLTRDLVEQTREVERVLAH